MGYIYGKVLSVNGSMHHKDVTGLEVVLLVLGHDEIDGTSLEGERDRLAVKILEHLRLIEQSHIDSTSVRAVIVDYLIVGLSNLRFHHQIFQHETVLDLRNSEQSMPGTVLLLHGPDHLGHVLKLLLILRLGPLVLSFRKELRVVLDRIVIYVEQVFQIIETHDIVL